MTVDDQELMDAGARARQTAALLREVRSALRRTDTVTALAASLEDPSLSLLAEARDRLERAVVQLTRHQQADHRQARTAAHRGR